MSDTTSKSGLGRDSVGNRRDTKTGRFLSAMAPEDQELVWARRINKMVKNLKENGAEFGEALEARLRRLATRASLLEDNDENENAGEAAEQSAAQMEGTLDLTDYLQWFKNQLDDKGKKNLKPEELYFLSAAEYQEAVDRVPQLWFDFTRYLVQTVVWADDKVHSISEVLAQTESEAARQAEDTATANEAHMEEIDSLLRHRDKYRNTINDFKNKNTELEKRVNELQQQLEAATAAAEQQDEGSASDGSEDSFLRGLRGDRNARTPKHVRFDETRRRDRSPTPQSNLTNNSTSGHNNARAPPKVEAFSGDRDKYDEWIGKLLSQMDASAEYFEGREERKINYLLQSISGSAYDLIKDTYGYSGRRANPNADLEGALKILDRAYYPVDTARTARAKLEQLTMGSNEAFNEFYPKFQAQVNRLKLSEEHKIDELTKRLNGRFANRILDGSETSYDKIVDRCYRMDSQLTMWNATNTSRRSETRSSSSRSNTSEDKGKSRQVDKADQETIKLGEFSKPLDQMSVSELKTWRAGLPRGRIIVERIRKEGRCLGCQQKGHTKFDPKCVLNKLYPPDPTVNTTTTTEDSGKVLA